MTGLESEARGDGDCRKVFVCRGFLRVVVLGGIIQNRLVARIPCHIRATRAARY
jgi:hypothetical protein